MSITHLGVWCELIACDTSPSSLTAQSLFSVKTTSSLHSQPLTSGIVLRVNYVLSKRYLLRIYILALDFVSIIAGLCHGMAPKSHINPFEMVRLCADAAKTHSHTRTHTHRLWPCISVSILVIAAAILNWFSCRVRSVSLYPAKNQLFSCCLQNTL